MVGKGEKYLNQDRSPDTIQPNLTLQAMVREKYLNQDRSPDTIQPNLTLQGMVGEKCSVIKCKCAYGNMFICEVYLQFLLKIDLKIV